MQVCKVGGEGEKNPRQTPCGAQSSTQGSVSGPCDDVSLNQESGTYLTEPRRCAQLLRILIKIFLKLKKEDVFKLTLNFGCLGAAWVAQRFSATFSPGPDPGDRD